MAPLAHYSPTALSTAAAGKRLPSWEVTKAYVEVCGGDVQAWHERWSAVRATLTDEQPTPHQQAWEPEETWVRQGPEFFSESDYRRRRFTRRTTVIALCLGLVIALTITAYMTVLRQSDEPSARQKEERVGTAVALDTLSIVEGGWAFRGQTANLGGATYPDTMRQNLEPCTAPEAAVEYNLGKNFTRLVAFVGIDDNSPNSSSTASIVIEADGRTISSNQLSFGAGALRLDTDLTGVLRLKITIKAEQGSPICKPLGIDMAQATLFPTASSITTSPAP